MSFVTLNNTSGVTEEASDVVVPHMDNTHVDSEIVPMELLLISTDRLLLGMLQCLLVVAIPLTFDLGHDLVDVKVPVGVVPDDQLSVIALHQYSFRLIPVRLKVTSPYRRNMRITNSSDVGFIFP